jgi:hypothetical protein
MRTTVRLNGPLLERARQEAARQGITLTALIEQGLGLALRRPLKKSKKQLSFFRFPAPRAASDLA